MAFELVTGHAATAHITAEQVSRFIQGITIMDDTTVYRLNNGNDAALSISTLTVTIATGETILHGFHSTNEEALQIPLDPTTTAGNSRIDKIVMEVLQDDTTGVQYTSILTVQGEESTTPTAPDTPSSSGSDTITLLAVGLIATVTVTDSVINAWTDNTVLYAGSFLTQEEYEEDLGNTDISEIGDGTLTGAIDEVNDAIESIDPDGNGIIAVANGGTGKTSVTSGKVLVGAGTNAMTEKTIETSPANGSTNLITSGAVYTVSSNANTAKSNAAKVLKEVPWYATCSTAASTTAKVASCNQSGFALTTGCKVIVKFTYTNTAAAPTLNVASKGAKSIMAYGTTVPTVWWVAGDVVEFTYDGTNWIMQPTQGAVEALNTNLTNVNTNLNDILNNKHLVSSFMPNLVFINSTVCSANGYIDSTATFSAAIDTSKAFVVAQSMSNCAASVVSLTSTSMTVRLYNLHAYDESAGTMQAKYSILIF